MVLPPHPGPVVIAKELKANIGHVLLYGIIIAIPVTLIAGPIFNKFAQNSSHLLIHVKGYFSTWFTKFKASEMPSFGLSISLCITCYFNVIINGCSISDWT